MESEKCLVLRKKVFWIKKDLKRGKGLRKTLYKMRKSLREGEKRDISLQKGLIGVIEVVAIAGKL